MRPATRATSDGDGAPITEQAKEGESETNASIKQMQQRSQHLQVGVRGFTFDLLSGVESLSSPFVEPSDLLRFICALDIPAAAAADGAAAAAGGCCVC